jgi:hypothetical protein
MLMMKRRRKRRKRRAGTGVLLGFASVDCVASFF